MLSEAKHRVWRGTDVSPAREEALRSAQSDTRRATNGASGALGHSLISNLQSLVIFLAFALRVFRLGDANIWWDEGLAIWAVRKSFQGVTAWTAGDVHPPLYFWTLWPWTRLAGESEFAARFITAIVGVLTVALVMRLGQAIGGPWLGLLAGTLLATSRFHIWWSQEMRMYALAGLLNVAALLALAIWWRSGSRRALVGYVLAAAGSLYTIYLSAVMLVVYNLWVGARLLGRRTTDECGASRPWPRRPGPRGRDGRPRGHKGTWPMVGRRSSIVRCLAAWSLAQVAVLALFAPWLAYAVGRMSSWSVAEPINYAFVLQLQATLLTTGVSTDIGQVAGLVAIVGVVVVAGILLLARQRETWPWLALLLLVLVLPSLVIFALALPRGLFYNPRVEARYFLPFAPPVYVLFAWALLALWRWRKTVGAAALVVVGAVWLAVLPSFYAGRYLRDDLQSMVQTLRAHARPDDVVVLVSGNRYPVFLYYYERLLEEPRPPVEQIPRNALILAADNVDRELRRVVRDRDRVWLAWVNGPLQDPDELAPAWLRQRLKPALSYGFAHNSLTLFTGGGATAPVTRPPTEPLSPAMGGGRITGYDQPVREYRPGDTARIGVYWGGPAQTARVGLAAQGGGTPPAIARPIELPAGPARVQIELPIHPFVAPGGYALRLTTTQGEARLGDLVVTHSEAPGSPATRLDAQLGDKIRLEGVSLLRADGRPTTTLKPGETVYVDLFWAADSPVDTPLTVFVHLLGAAFNPATGGPIWAGHDSPPANGTYPTGWWDASTRLRDRHPLTLPLDTPPGEYLIEIGLYDAGGARLPTQGANADPGQRRILTPKVTVHD